MPANSSEKAYLNKIKDLENKVLEFQTNKIYFENLFEQSPNAFWEEDLSELKLMLDELKKNGIKDFKKYFDENPDFILECASKIKVVNINKAAVKLHKAKNKKHLTENIAETFNDKSKEVFKQELLALANGETMFSSETEMLTFDGETIYVTMDIFALENQSSSLSKVIVSYTNISDKVKNINEINNLNKKLLEERNVFIKGNVVVFKWKNDEKWTIDYVSPNVKNVFGYTQKDFLNNNITYSYIIHEDDIERVKIEVERAILNKQDNFEHEPYRIIKKDKKIVWLYDFTTVIKNKNNEITHFLGYVKDITKDKLLEQEKEELFAEVNNQFNEYSILNQQYKLMYDELEEKNEKLLISEEKFKKLSNLTFEGILIHRKGLNLEINKPFADMFGYTIEELAGKNVINKLAVKKHLKIIGEKSKLDHALPYEIEGIKKDGTIFPLELESKFLIYQGENVRVTSVRDITFKKEAEEALLKSEQNFKALFEYSPLGISTADPNGNILNANQALLDILGSPSIEATKQINLLNYPELIKNGFANDFKKAVNSKEILKKEYLYTSKWGKTANLWEHIVPLKDKNDDVYEIYIIIENITERKTIENELFSQKNLFETMFNSISDAVIITNTERKIILFNDSSLNLFQYSSEEIIGQKTEIFYENPNEFKNAGKKVFNENSVQDNELYIVKYKDKNGRVFHGETFGAKLFNKKNDWIGNLGVIRDVSEQMIMLNDLNIAKDKAEESNLLKTAFLNNLSHEIRTPMNSIIGFSQLLNNKALNDTKRESFVKKINNSSKQLLSIVEDIINISKIESNQEELFFETVSINNLLTELYDTYEKEAESKNIQLFFENLLNPEDCFVYTDIAKLKQILNNLISNAIKFTNQGKIEFGCILKDKILEFFVKDSGIGIEKNMHEQIFERFRQVEVDTTRDFGGIGLGLSISKEYVEMLNGKIWLISEVDKGSEFYFNIPFMKNENKETELIENEHKVNYKLENTTILIAEDNELNFVYLEELLSITNAKILHVTNGFEAVKICKTNKNIDLVLMDIKMPKLNGFEATLQIKKLRPDLPIIAQTAYAFTDDKAKAIHAGCDDYIAKPIVEADFFDILKKYL